jgi:hypothetical protein
VFVSVCVCLRVHGLRSVEKIKYKARHQMTSACRQILYWRDKRKAGLIKISKDHMLVSIRDRAPD